MRGLSAILARGARIPSSDGVGRLVLDVDAALIAVSVAIRGVAFLPSCRALGGKRSNVQALAQQVNTLEVGEALDQPADPVMDREPGLVCRWMPVTPPPAPDRLLEARSKAGFATMLVAAPVSLRGGRMSLRLVVPSSSGFLSSQLLGF